MAPCDSLCAVYCDIVRCGIRLSARWMKWGRPAADLPPNVIVPQSAIRARPESGGAVRNVMGAHCSMRLLCTQGCTVALRSSCTRGRGGDRAVWRAVWVIQSAPQHLAHHQLQHLHRSCLPHLACCSGTLLPKDTVDRVIHRRRRSHHAIGRRDHCAHALIGSTVVHNLIRPALSLVCIRSRQHHVAAAIDGTKALCYQLSPQPEAAMVDARQPAPRQRLDVRGACAVLWRENYLDEGGGVSLRICALVVDPKDAALDRRAASFPLEQADHAPDGREDQGTTT